MCLFNNAGYIVAREMLVLNVKTEKVYKIYQNNFLL